MKPRIPFASAMGLLAPILFLAGCGDGGPPRQVIKGKVSKGGEVMKVKEQVGRLRVFFLRQDDQGPADPREATVNFADGAFEVKGPDGRGIPAGKYKICVEWKDDFSPFGKDKLAGKFNEANSKILRDIPGSGDIVIDVSKPEG